MANGDILGTLFAGPSSPNLTPEQNAQARRQAILQAGLAGLLMSGPQPFRPGLAQIIAQSALTGQAAGQRARSGLALQNAVGGAGVPSTAELQRVFLDLVASGDIESANQVGQLLQVMAQSGPRLMEIDRGEVIELVDPSTGETVREIPKQPELVSTNVGDVILWHPPGRPDQVVHRQEVREAPFVLIDRLADDFYRESTVYQDIATAARAAEAAEKEDTAVADQTLIVAFNKMIDPTSVVRESEFARVAAAGGFPAQVQAFVNRFLEEGRLPGFMRQQLISQIRSLARQHAASAQRVIDRFRYRAERAGVDPEQVTFDPFEGLDLETRDALTPYLGR